MGFTTDSIWSDRIRIFQSKQGYRFALDSVLLAHFLTVRPTEEVLEIGAGNGVIAVLLSHLQEFKHLLAVEIQHELAALCKKNFRQNRMKNSRLLEADLRDLEQTLPLHSFDLIYSNPPYRKSGTGRVNSSLQRAIARHEIRMRLEDLFLCAQKFLKPQGRLSVILPQFRESDFCKLVMQYRMTWRERKYVRSFQNQPPVFFLATVSAFASPYIEHRKLVVYDAPGHYTPEMQNLLREP